MILNVYGKKYNIENSERKNKKFKAKVGDSFIHFGDSNATIKPGTPKGDSYCARSLGIPNKPGLTANEFSRAMWGCKGKRSYK